MIDGSVAKHTSLQILGKQFFFEKKNQKTFATTPAPKSDILLIGACVTAAEEKKSFGPRRAGVAFFSKKDSLPYLPPAVISAHTPQVRAHAQIGRIRRHRRLAMRRSRQCASCSRCDGMSGFICHQDRRGVATLTLDRPHIHNAFDDSVIGGLTQALHDLAENPSVRALVLAANGRSFSAGADLDWMRRMAGFSHEENLRDAAGLAALMVALDTFPRPTIAKVQGSAYGGGVGLVACCDIAIAVSKALFCLSEVRIGLIPAVISPYVVNAIGARQARRYFQTAEAFSAQRAHEIGLVHELSDVDAIDEKVEDLIASILQGAPGAQQEAKELVFLCAAGGEGLTQETARRIAVRRVSAEGKAGVQAFLAKAPPPWLAK